MDIPLDGFIGLVLVILGLSLIVIYPVIFGLVLIIGIAIIIRSILKKKKKLIE